MSEGKSNRKLFARKKANKPINIPLSACYSEAFLLFYVWSRLEMISFLCLFILRCDTIRKATTKSWKALPVVHSIIAKKLLFCFCFIYILYILKNIKSLEQSLKNNTVSKCGKFISCKIIPFQLCTFVKFLIFSSSGKTFYMILICYASNRSTVKSNKSPANPSIFLALFYM